MNPLQKPKSIVIHCSDTPPTMDIGVEEIRNWHVNERGWADIGYHFVIRQDGTLEIGRSLAYDGAHVFGHNDDTIGICMVGRDEPHFTKAQWETLHDLVEGLMLIYPSIRSTVGHRDLDPKKTCPGFDVVAWFKREMLYAR